MSPAPIVKIAPGMNSTVQTAYTNAKTNAPSSTFMPAVQHMKAFKAVLI